MGRGITAFDDQDVEEDLAGVAVIFVHAEPEDEGRRSEDLAARPGSTGYEVWITPFGYTCEWDLSVHGESMAKVFKTL